MSRQPHYIGAWDLFRSSSAPALNPTSIIDGCRVSR
jgi:hypothetical protein